MCPDFRGGAKKQPVPWPGGPGYNGAYANEITTCWHSSTYTYLLFFRWHRLGISVKGNSITAIVDCKKQQNREIARVPEDTIATDGIVLLGQEIEDNTFFPGNF